MHTPPPFLRRSERTMVYGKLERRREFVTLLFNQVSQIAITLNFKELSKKYKLSNLLHNDRALKKIKFNFTFLEDKLILSLLF